MSKERILVVEDEEDVLELIQVNLQRNGYQVETAMTGEEALKKIGRGFDLILLDLMLPELDGLDVCKKIRQTEILSDIPIIMVTARTDEADIVTGLELGADDYITKPFSPRVLLARVKSVLRRRQDKIPAETDNIKVHNIEIDSARHRVNVDGREVKLTLTEFSILKFLASRPGWVFTRYQIVDAVHGTDYPVTDRSVDVQIVSLRNKLDKAGKNIETVRGIGYRFRE